MKIGILSMQRVANYGSWLQAFALKQLLLNNGAQEVRFIDIQKGRQIITESLFARIKRVIREVITYGIKGRINLRRHGKITQERFKLFYALLDSDSNTVTKDINMVVIGSDEVFNAIQQSSWGYTPQLFGKIDCPYVISYAGSFGHTTVKQLKEYGIDEEISITMKTLKAISVRDYNSYNIVKELAGIKPELHLDPVLIYGYKKEIDAIKVNTHDNYVLIYSYNGRIINKSEITNIKIFSKRNNLKIKSLFCNYSWCDEELVPKTPIDALTSFKNATYIITDTFHGSIFSIITHSKFCTIVRGSNNNKIQSLLSMLGLENHLTSDCSNLDKIMWESIDYEAVEFSLSGYRKQANHYLKNNISAAYDNK